MKKKKSYDSEIVSNLNVLNMDGLILVSVSAVSAQFYMYSTPADTPWTVYRGSTDYPRTKTARDMHRGP